jgi:hypothetical protein
MLAFSPVDKYLYIGVGDGGASNDPPNNAQNINVLLGKICASTWTTRRQTSCTCHRREIPFVKSMAVTRFLPTS